MKKQYITPSTDIIFLASEDICQVITGSDGHNDGKFVPEEHIGSAGDIDGEDFAKRYDAWSSWDD